MQNQMASGIQLPATRPLLFGFLLGPTAWLTQLSLVYALAELECSGQVSRAILHVVTAAAVATAAEARWAGWIWATTVRTDPRPSQATSPCAASEANPRPCQGVPITQAISALWSSVTVAWTVPTRHDSARGRSTQLHQETDGSGEPATSRS